MFEDYPKLGAKRTADLLPGRGYDEPSYASMHGVYRHRRPVAA